MGGTQARGNAGGTGRSGSEGAGRVVACVFIPHFPLRVKILRHPELDSLPIALTDPSASLGTSLASAGQRRIVKCSPYAHERELWAGISLGEAGEASAAATAAGGTPLLGADGETERTGP